MRYSDRRGEPRATRAPWCDAGARVGDDRAVEFYDYDTRLAAYALITEDRPGGPCVLLALWNEAEQPRWTLPGGGAELEETVEETAVREVAEETGYAVALGDLLWVSSHVIPVERRIRATDRPMKAVRVVFAATVVGGHLRDEVGGTTDTARWIPVADVADLPHVSLVEEALARLR